jgi:hypothetical protein
MSYEIFYDNKKKVIFKYRWLLNRGDIMGRFDHTSILVKNVSLIGVYFQQFIYKYKLLIFIYEFLNYL